MEVWPRMRILFLTQYYPPETGAAQNRLSDLAMRLSKAGHQVTVLTALPSYPTGEIFPGYRGHFFLKNEEEGIRVVRTWVYATKRKSFLPRVANYVSFAMLSFVVGLLTVDRVEFVVVESPPLFLGFSAFFLSKSKGANLILNVSDLWPESAVVLGALRNPVLVRWATWAEGWLYRHARIVTGQTRGIVESIQRRSTKTCHLITNGVTPEFLEKAANARSAREVLRERYGFGTGFVVAYAGVHGLAQGLQHLLGTAELLTEQRNIHFCFFGDGPEKSRLLGIVNERGLKNVEFFPPVPAAEMAEILASVDVSIVPLKRDELFKGALPSKLFEGMGAGVPIVGALEGEARQVIEAAQCGICVEPENSAAMADAILSLYRDPELRMRLGENGRRYVAKHYNRKEIAAQFEQILAEVCGTAKSASKAPEKSQLTELPNNDAVFTGQTRE